jgi:hypothetical protein
MVMKSPEAISLPVKAQILNGTGVATVLFCPRSKVNAGKQGVAGENPTSVSRRYYVGIASVDGTVF